MTEATASSIMSEGASQYSSLLPATQKGSLVEAVQSQKVLTKYEVDITMKDGVGRFLESAPHVATIHAIANKIWAMRDKSEMIEVFELNSTTMKFRISNPMVCNRILKRRMWNLAGVPVVMAKWIPFTEDEKPEKNPIGVPVRLDPETAQCLNLKVSKIFVNADLTKKLPKSMFFNFNGKETLVEYTYPWLPKKCSNCDKWGHMAKVCLVNGGVAIEKKEEYMITGSEQKEKVDDSKKEGDKEEILTTEEETILNINGVGQEGLKDTPTEENDEVHTKDDEAGESLDQQ
ncbi:hypothetical protein N665_1099s0003 [Sinapis alba]|nr:hypothetical protein N665_1099s0003 [Sinapis alba]